MPLRVELCTSLDPNFIVPSSLRPLLKSKDLPLIPVIQSENEAIEFFLASESGRFQSFLTSSRFKSNPEDGCCVVA
jgi:hypothetical protein